MFISLKTLPVFFMLALCFFQAKAEELTEARKLILQAADVLYSNADSARILNQKALDAALSSQDSITAFKIFGVLEDIAGNPNDAFPFFNKAYDLAIRDGNGVEIGNILMNYGNMHQSLRNYDAALEYYLAAMAQMEKNNEPKDLQNKSAVRNNLGTLYKRMGLYEMSIQFYEKSIDYAKLHGDKRSLALAYSNIGGVKIKFDRLDEGYAYLVMADSIYTSLNELWGKSSLYLNYGLYHKKRNENEKAKYYATQKVEIDKLYKDSLRFMDGAFLLAEVFVHQGEYNQATEILDEIEVLALENKLFDDLVNIFELQAQIADLNNQPDIEVEKLKLALAYKDSVKVYATKEKLISLKAKEDISNSIFKLKEAEKQSQDLAFQLQKEKNFIILLSAVVLILITIVLFTFLDSRTKKRFSQELNIKNQQLNKINSNQQKLMSVLAHDFKSPLAATLGLIDLLEQNTLSESEKNEFLETIKRKIDSTIQNVENVVNWMNTQTIDFKVNKVDIYLPKFFDKLKDFVALQTTQKQIDLQVHIVDFELVHADENQLQIVLRNLLSNAIKFSHKSSNVEVYTKIRENRKVIEVVDYGVGINAKDLQLLKNQLLESKIGTQGEQGTGLGSRLINNFCKLNDIELEIESTLDKGSTFRLVFSQTA